MKKPNDTHKEWLKSLTSDIAIAIECIKLKLQGRCPFHLRRRRIEKILLDLELNLRSSMHLGLDLSFVRIDELMDKATKIAKEESCDD